MDEEPVSKTGGERIACGFESHGFRSVVLSLRDRKEFGVTECRRYERAHGPTGRHQLRTLVIRIQLPVSPLEQEKTVRWSNGNDAWLTSRKRWFNSIRDYFRW